MNSETQIAIDWCKNPTCNLFALMNVTRREVQNPDFSRYMFFYNRRKKNGRKDK